MSFTASAPRRSAFGPWALLAFALAALQPAANAVNTVYFSVNDPGVTKSVGAWGVDTAWPSYDNVRQSVEHLGPSNVDLVRVTFEPNHALVPKRGGGFELSAAGKTLIDNQLALAALAGPNASLTLVTGSLDSIDPSYVAGSGINVANWVSLIKSTQEYINTRPGFTNRAIAYIEPFNEPDFGTAQGGPSLLNAAIGQLKTFPVFQNTVMLSPSTLNSNLAQGWYDQTPEATGGSSHLLAGSLTSWVNFIEHVKSTGKTFSNPELHSMGEMIVGAEHGMTMGITWGDILRARGLFMQASDGKRLGYAEDLQHQSAAAVYRAPDGRIYAFAGGLERDYTGSPSSFRFVSTDQDVYFNGIPVREYMLATKTDGVVSETDNDFANYGSWSSQGAYADIQTSAAAAAPPLDGYRWKIVNAQTGQVMEVAGGASNDGALIRSAADTGGANQMWNIVRTRNGYLELYNANSGRTAEVASGSLNNGASVRQWGTADNSIQQWYIDEAGDGNYFLRNAYSNKYLTSDPVNSTQSSLTGSDLQKWRFVLANPTDGPTRHYPLHGNAQDVVAAANGTAFGSPAYAAGPDGTPGTAIRLDGVNDYVSLPASLTSSTDITISASVRWDGGGAWQRIFDFGADTTSYMFLTPRSGDNTLRFAITTDGSGAEQVLETAALPVGEWVNLTVTLGGNTGVLYINGLPRVAGQIFFDPSDLAATKNYLGKSQFASDPLFKGLVSDVQVFDYALTQQQVLNLARPGDFNGDGLVDAADYTTWRDGLGTTYSQSDYTTWASHFGADYNSSASSGGVSLESVPEPSGLASVSLTLAMLLTPYRKAPIRS